MSKADELGEHIADLMNDSGLEPADQMEVALNVVLSILANTKCPGCRKLRVDWMAEAVLVAKAMVAPSERDHVH
jgi:hypothetical protein